MEVNFSTEMIIATVFWSIFGIWLWGYLKNKNNPAKKEIVTATYVKRPKKSEITEEDLNKIEKEINSIISSDINEKNILNTSSMLDILYDAIDALNIIKRWVFTGKSIGVAKSMQFGISSAYEICSKTCEYLDKINDIYREKKENNIGTYGEKQFQQVVDLACEFKEMQSDLEFAKIQVDKYVARLLELEQEKEQRHHEALKNKEVEKNKLIKIYGALNYAKITNGQLFIGMPKDILVKIKGKPEEVITEVKDGKTTEVYSYQKKVGARGGIAYGLVVRLENNVVVGWKTTQKGL